uniref:Uncharacterized protein n=1 Tax=Peronospora matthiolae TaxID=2874970 RepID=A0AAV1UDC9_9STRA
MGMACDIEGRTGTEDHEVLLPKTDERCRGVQSNGMTTTIEAETSGLNPEETAMILTSLSKGFSPGQMMARDAVPDVVDEMVEGVDAEDENASQRRCHFLASAGGGRQMHRVQQINFDGPEGSKLDFTDDAGFSHRFRNESNRVKSLVTKHISIEELRAHFDRPIIDVAKDFGICITLMKKICRRNGIKRWPHRQIRSLSKSIASMEAAMLSAHGSERDKYRDQIANLERKREAVIADPNKDDPMRPKTFSPSSVMDRGSTTDEGLWASWQLPLSVQLSPQLAQDTHALPQTSPASSSSTVTTGPSKGGRWTSEEHAAFLEGIRLYGKDWRRVAQVVKTRSAVQTRTHAQKYLLKFAGRFPFDTDGALKGQPMSPVQPQATQCAPQPVTSALSPTTRTTSSDAAATTSPSDETMSSGSWASSEQDPQRPVQHSKGSCTTSDGRCLQAELGIVSRGRENVKIPVLPPLSSRTTFRAKRSAAAAFQPHSHPLKAAPGPFQYLRCNNSNRVP